MSESPLPITENNRCWREKQKNVMIIFHWWWLWIWFFLIFIYLFIDVSWYRGIHFLLHFDSSSNKRKKVGEFILSCHCARIYYPHKPLNIPYGFTLPEFLYELFISHKYITFFFHIHSLLKKLYVLPHVHITHILSLDFSVFNFYIQNLLVVYLFLDACHIQNSHLFMLFYMCIHFW